MHIYTSFIRNILRALAICVVTICTGNAQPASVSSLKLLGEYVVPHNLQFKGTTVGGLSGIDYDAKKDVYYLISDDRSAINPARFYTVAIIMGDKGINKVNFKAVNLLLQKNGSIYPNEKQDRNHTPDPEAIRYNAPANRLVWSSEGEREVRQTDTILEDPTITIMNMDGRYIDTLPLPQQLRMHATKQGPRKNSVFEGLTFADNYKTLYVSVEEPLYQDGPQAGLKDTATWIRILKYDITTKKLTGQYAYHLDAVPYPAFPATGAIMNGVSEILAVDHNQLLVMERSYSKGRLSCAVRIYLADITNASNIAGVSSLRENPPATVAGKRLLVNFEKLGKLVDNFEGMTFGPVLPNGHKTLICMVDNNFSALERTQFFLFEVMP